MSDTFDHELQAYEMEESMNDGLVGRFLPTEEELSRPPMSNNDIDMYNFLNDMF